MPELTTDVLPQFYHLPICDAAKELGVCETLLKKFCRTNGISRWPHRKIKSIQNIVQQLQNQISQSKDKGEIARFNQEIEDYEKKKEMLISDPNLDFSLLVPKSVLQSFSKVKLKNEKRKINFDFDNQSCSKTFKEHVDKRIEEKLLKENCVENQLKNVDTIDSTIATKIEKKKPLKKPLYKNNELIVSSLSRTSSSTYFSSPEKGVSPVASLINNVNNIIVHLNASETIKKPQLAPQMKLSFDLSPLSSFSLNDCNSQSNNNIVNNNKCNTENSDKHKEKNNNGNIKVEDKKEEMKDNIAKYTFLEIPITKNFKHKENILTKRNFDEFIDEEEQRESEFQRFKSSLPALKYQRIFSESIPLYYIH